MSNLEPGTLYRGRVYISPTHELFAKYNVVGIRNMAMTLTQHQPINTARPILQVLTSNTTIILTPQIMDQSIVPTDTGATGPMITVARPVVYTLRSYSVCGEKQASVTVLGCPSQVYVPNVFSPNDDGQNDLFAISARNIGEATLSVFSRWGDLFYQETSTTLSGWDGTTRGQHASAGVYIYLLVYREASTGERRELRGTVTLLQ
ncbi:MAG: gliding motility-associated C-terminal domain-containing protein [Saprospiraceae bacterium]